MVEPTRLIAGRYRVTRLLGRSGFADVWHAIDCSTRRPVAVKVLAQGLLGDADAVERFRHEAAVVSGIDDPGIVPVLDSRLSREEAFIVFPFISGCTLRDRIRQGPLPSWQAMLIAIGLARTLAETHRRGIIHRDLKPENVLLADRSRPMLTDFGLCKTRGSAVQTRRGVILGTPGYVSPEQLEEGAVGAASDQFSLGIILYEMLTAERPFPGSSPSEEAIARLHQAPRPIQLLKPSLPPGVASLVMRMLERCPGDRFDSLQAAHDAMQVAAQQLQVDQEQDGPGHRHRRASALRTARARVSSALSAIELRTRRGRHPAARQPTARPGSRLLVSALGVVLALTLTALWSHARGKQAPGEEPAGHSRAEVWAPGHGR